jgi:hypothetical protein
MLTFELSTVEADFLRVKENSPNAAFKKHLFHLFRQFSHRKEPRAAIFTFDYQRNGKMSLRVFATACLFLVTLFNDKKVPGKVDVSAA